MSGRITLIHKPSNKRLCKAWFGEDGDKFIVNCLKTFVKQVDVNLTFQSNTVCTLQAPYNNTLTAFVVHFVTTSVPLLQVFIFQILHFKYSKKSFRLPPDIQSYSNKDFFRYWYALCQRSIFCADQWNKKKSGQILCPDFFADENRILIVSKSIQWIFIVLPACREKNLCKYIR